MISLIKGVLLKITEDSIILETGGLGYEVHVHARTINHLPAQGQSVLVYTRMHVTENDLKLYGFLDEEELNLFNILISLSGMGARGALNILAAMEPEKFCRAIVSQDEKLLVSVPGIGKKSAQRLIFELKDKLGDFKFGQALVNSQVNDLIQALEVLGYTRSEVIPMVYSLQESGQLDNSTENNIKIILRKLTRD